MKTSNKSSTKRLVLLDSHAILHRAYHALPDFASSKGEPTGALYGLVTMLINIIDQLKPDYVVACFDLPKPTYRHEAYKDYKAGRAKTDEALITQIIRSRDVFGAFSIPIYEKEGFEADDMLGTIAECLKKEKNIEIVIASGDMDTLQLVDNKKVQVYTLKKGIKETILYDEDGVKERFGFGPLLLPDYKGLRGDPSDNIIGIKGIGEKTATQLITTFGSIEDIYKALKKNKETFKKEGFTDRIIKLTEDGEEEALFSKMLATIRRDAPIDFKIPEKIWRETISIEKVLELFKALEFRSLGIRVKELLGMTDAFGDDLVEDQESKDNAVLAATSFDPTVFKKAQIALWVLDSNYTNPSIEDIQTHTKTNDLKKSLVLLEQHIEEKNLSDVYKKIELPLTEVIERMSRWGIKVDEIYLKKLAKKYHDELDSLEKKIHVTAGEEFNINSPRQLGSILFEKLQLKAKNQKKTAGGALSTRESELEKLKDEHAIIADILLYRELQKLLSTYIDVIPGLIDQDDKRLHTTFIQTGSTTGRMASHNPNLQNIPIKTELGRAIRSAFIAEDGYELAEFDYSQIELRVAAFLSKDKKLIDIFKSGRDVHTEVAARVFKVPSEDVDKEMRRKAKVINFGILYGMGVNALRMNLGGDRKEAQQFYNEYFATFTELAAYLESVKADTVRKGYTETFFGRRRYFEGITSKLPFIRAQAERMAINAPIQGTGADIIKKAMINMYDHFKDNKDVRLLLQIHDSVIVEIKKEKIEQYSKEITKIMESTIDSNETEGVPLMAHAEHGKSWGDMK